jgi:hypothetical protein
MIIMMMTMIEWDSRYQRLKRHQLQQQLAPPAVPLDDDDSNDDDGIQIVESKRCNTLGDFSFLIPCSDCFVSFINLNLINSYRQVVRSSGGQIGHQAGQQRKIHAREPKMGKTFVKSKKKYSSCFPTTNSLHKERSTTKLNYKIMVSFTTYHR